MPSPSNPSARPVDWAVPTDSEAVAIRSCIDATLFGPDSDHIRELRRVALSFLDRVGVRPW